MQILILSVDLPIEERKPENSTVYPESIPIHLNPIPYSTQKGQDCNNFGLSECNRVNRLLLGIRVCSIYSVYAVWIFRASSVCRGTKKSEYLHGAFYILEILSL